jgi:hypothetical protein
MIPPRILCEGIAPSGFCNARKTGQIGAFNVKSRFSHDQHDFGAEGAERVKGENGYLIVMPIKLR